MSGVGKWTSNPPCFLCKKRKAVQSLPGAESLLWALACCIGKEKRRALLPTSDIVDIDNFPCPEIAGFVLASLPLMISALEHYRETAEVLEGTW